MIPFQNVRKLYDAWKEKWKIYTFSPTNICKKTLRKVKMYGLIVHHYNTKCLLDNSIVWISFVMPYLIKL